MKASSKTPSQEKKRKREGKEAAKDPVAAEPPSKKTKASAESAAKTDEPRTFATTQEWLESERWSAITVAEEEEDLYDTIVSPNVDLWFIKAPAQFDPTALLARQFYVEDFTELKPGQASSHLAITTDDKRYTVHAADPGEYRQLLDLVPSADSQRPLLGKPFQRGFNIAEAADTQAATTAPVRARPIVPQPSNLRLRFRPPGYVMTKKEQKQQELTAKKHKKAVAVAKLATPPLRPVPVLNIPSLLTSPDSEVDDGMDEDVSQGAKDEDEVPLERKKKKKSKKSSKTTNTSQDQKKGTPSKKPKKKGKEKSRN